MIARPLLSRLRPLALLALLGLSGCAGQMAYREGQSLAAHDNIEAALLKLQEAAAADPDNARFRSAYLQLRDRSVQRLVDQAMRALADGHPDLARVDLARALAIDPANERAHEGLRTVEADQRHRLRMDEARASLERKDPAGARRLVEAILSERPDYAPARAMLTQIDEAADRDRGEAALSAAFRQSVTIEFRDAPLRQVFEVLARRSGLNFLFDKDVKTDQRTSIFLKDSTVEAAIDSLLLTNQLEQRVMDNNTILIYPNLPAKQKDYQEMVVRSFYLSNADAKVVANSLKTILKSRDVVVDEKLNMIIVRDSPDAIRLAEKLVALQDVAEPEVMLEVEVLEVNRSSLTNLGVQWPGKLTFAPLETADNGPLTIAQLKDLNSYNVGVSGLSATVNANRTVGDTNLLANPRIRVRNKEKAKILIGQKIPNITTTISPGTGGFASESVNYVDVGLTLNVEPTIYLNNEVGIRIALEVSNIVDKITTATGTVAYQIGTRQASTFLQLKDGENQVLAGLINNEERSSGNHLPGLGDIPLLGRLFGSDSNDSQKTEIVLSITPHLIRTVQRPSAANAQFSAGTESSFRRRADGPVRQPQNGPSSNGPSSNGPSSNGPRSNGPRSNGPVPNGAPLSGSAQRPGVPANAALPPPSPMTGGAPAVSGMPSSTVAAPLPPSSSVVSPEPAKGPASPPPEPVPKP